MSIKRYAAHTNIDDFKSDWHESKDGQMVKYSDYSALEQQLTALTSQLESVVAELSAVLTDRAVILEDLDNTYFEIGMMRGEKSESYPVPVVVNHDAFLAEVRASGVDQFKEYMLTTGYPWEGDYHSIGRMTDLFAATLRQEAAK